MNFTDILLNHGDPMLELIMEQDIRCRLCTFVGHYFELDFVGLKSTNNL